MLTPLRRLLIPAATVCALLILAFTFALGFSPAADAKTLKVTRYNDPKPGKCKPRDCSLREAVIAANRRDGRDKVVLPGRKKRYELRREGDGGPENLGLNITDPVTILHRGKGRATIDANRIDSVLYVESPARLVRLTIRGGRGIEGGGLWAFLPPESSGSVTLLRSRVVHNVATGGGGGVHVAAGELHLQRSTVSGNRALVGGGVVSSFEEAVLNRSAIRDNRAADDGGGIWSPVMSLTAKKSTIAANRAGGDGGGIFLGFESTVDVRGSTLSGNRSTAGGAIYNAGGVGSLVNSTLAGNRADASGGGIAQNPGGSSSLNAVTLARNTADADSSGAGNGGGITNGGAFELTNSIVANNRLGDGTLDQCAGSFASLGHNVVNPGCSGLGVLGDRIVGPAHLALAKLKQNGGPTKTIALRTRASAAVGAANAETAPKRDQRGKRRDAKPDSGAYERK